MLKPAAATAQTELEMVTLDQLVPRDHLLRLIDTHIRFDFIREKTEGLYCSNNGRPAIDPVVLFKMLFIGYLFGGCAPSASWCARSRSTWPTAGFSGCA